MSVNWDEFEGQVPAKILQKYKDIYGRALEWRSDFGGVRLCEI